MNSALSSRTIAWYNFIYTYNLDQEGDIDKDEYKYKTLMLSYIYLLSTYCM